MHRAPSNTSIVLTLRYFESSRKLDMRREEMSTESHHLYILMNEAVKDAPELDQGRCKISARYY